jgi:GDPmannose 4,6-dehydratase
MMTALLPMPDEAVVPVASGAGRRALILGVAGQDGSWLAEFLIRKGYRVVGATRPHADGVLHENLTDAVMEGLKVVNCDVTDAAAVRALLAEEWPPEIYNLAAISHVGSSWDQVESVWRTNVHGFLNVLEAVRQLNLPARIYQASSSEMYGNVAAPQDEATPMRPASPYGASKVAAHNLASIYRLSHGMFVATGICFNHESERRSPRFLSRKVARGVAMIVLGHADTITLGHLDPRRDWGYAPDYVEAMWMMLQQDRPDDFVIATGESHSVGDLVQRAFNHVGITDWLPHVRQDSSLVRPVEIHRLVGSAKKAERVLGWRPTVGFDEMVRRMVDHEIAEHKE